MSKLTEYYRTQRVYNQHDFYESVPGTLSIGYTPNGDSRSMVYAHWKVYISGGRTDPDGHFRDYGNKPFGVWSMSGATHSERKARALGEAMAWAEEKYGPIEWTKDPYGGYGPAEFVEARKAELGKP